MRTKELARRALAVAACSALSACVTLPPNSPRSPQDPWESWNRGVYKFNDKLDRAIAKPAAKAYVRVVPRPTTAGCDSSSMQARLSLAPRTQEYYAASRT